MAFRVLDWDEVIPERPKFNGRKRNTEADKIAASLRAGQRVEIPINSAKGAKRQITSIRGSMAYRGLAVSVRSTDKHIYLAFSREVTPQKR